MKKKLLPREGNLPFLSVLKDRAPRKESGGWLRPAPKADIAAWNAAANVGGYLEHGRVVLCQHLTPTDGPRCTVPLLALVETAPQEGGT